MKQRALSFDTLAFAKKIETAGFSFQQAEAISAGMMDIFDKNLNPTLFTKEDGLLLKTELKDDMHRLETDLRADMHRLETKIILWVMGLLIAQTGIIISIIKLIH